jgi:2,3-bisphosphoglycerate-independent phosphoglycerate mutase
VRDDIEALDAGMNSYWSDLAPDSTLVTVITTDHTTPSVWSDHPRGKFSDQHSGEEVPIVIRGGTVRVDAVTQFGERAAAAGTLGHLRGEDFMPVLLNAAERTNMWEMRPAPTRRLYRFRPDEIEPFRLE